MTEPWYTEDEVAKVAEWLRRVVYADQPEQREKLTATLEQRAEMAAYIEEQEPGLLAELGIAEDPCDELTRYTEERGYMTTNSVEFYRDNAQEWRWRIRANNNKILACSGEGYNNKADAITGLLLTVLGTEVVDVAAAAQSAADMTYPAPVAGPETPAPTAGFGTLTAAVVPVPQGGAGFGISASNESFGVSASGDIVAGATPPVGWWTEQDGAMPQ